MRWPAKTSPGARSAIASVVAGLKGAALGAAPSSAVPRRSLLPLLCLLGLALPAAAQAAPEPGMNLSLPFGPNDLAHVQQSGAKTVRFFMFTTNTPSQFDEPVSQLAGIGVKPVFVI